MINHVSKDIIQRFQCNKFIETGVFTAITPMIIQDWFIEIFGESFNVGPWNQGVKGKYQIYEIECNQKYVDDYLIPNIQSQLNVNIAVSDSVEWLKNSITNNLFTIEDSCFFYLDSHQHSSQNPEPLCDEIIQLKRLQNKPIISIDDWAVPGYYKDIYSTDMIRHLIKDRTDVIYYSKYFNFHGKNSCFIFLDRYFNELNEKLKGLPLIKEML